MKMAQCQFFCDVCPKREFELGGQFTDFKPLHPNISNYILYTLLKTLS